MSEEEKPRIIITGSKILNIKVQSATHTVEGDDKIILYEKGKR